MTVKLTFTLVAFLVATAAFGNEPSDRQQILDAIRPLASKEADQLVRIKVDRLNIDSGWAMLVGELVALPGKKMDWERTSSCHPDLDKMLWVVLHKKSGSWLVKHMEICAPEPPYWYLEHYGGFVWPCGVYKGIAPLDGAGTLEGQCKRERNGKKR